MQSTRTLKGTKIILLLGNKSLAIKLLQICSKFVKRVKHCSISKMNDNI